MARKRTSGLTEAELRLMEVIWAKREATVQEVADAFAGTAPLAYSTVLTTLRILENKGYVLHQKGGRAFVYKPKIERDEARDSALDDLLRRYFDNNAEALVAWLKKRSG